MGDKPQTREQFKADLLARYLAEGMAMEAAKARAVAVLISHWPLTMETNADFQWDRHSPENQRWHE